MFKCIILSVLLVSVECSFINFEMDKVVESDIFNVSQVDKASRGFSEIAEDYHLARSGGPETLLPLLMVAGVKLVGLLPLVLTTLALVAGFSLASSKAALLLGGGLVIYYFFKENKLFLPVAAKHIPALPEWSPNFQHLDHHTDFARDRIFNTKRMERGS